jgi:hypothetical protein
MAVFSKAQEGVNGRVQVLLRESNGFCSGAPEKTSKPGTSVLPSAPGQHHHGFKHRGNTDYHCFGFADPVDQALKPRLLQFNRDYR